MNQSKPKSILAKTQSATTDSTLDIKMRECPSFNKKCSFCHRLHHTENTVYADSRQRPLTMRELSLIPYVLPLLRRKIFVASTSTTTSTTTLMTVGFAVRPNRRPLFHSPQRLTQMITCSLTSISTRVTKLKLSNE